jgi:hypothetical protein
MTHRSFDSRLAQQIARHVNYDPEYGFELPCWTEAPRTTPVLRLQGHSQMPERMRPSHSQQATLFVSAKKGTSFGVGAAWKEGNDWKTKSAPLGKYLTESEAVLFAINMVAKDLLQTLSRTNQRRAEIVTTSRPALMEVQSVRRWMLPITADIRRQTQRVEEEGGRVVLTWLSSDNACEGYEVADSAAERMARQQPKDMRSASRSYVKQAIKEKWKARRKINKHVENARKSVAARYLQPQQTNSSPPHAGVPEVAKRARSNAAEITLRKADDQLEARPDGHGGIVQRKGNDSRSQIYRSHRSRQEARQRHKQVRLVGR